VSESSLRRTPLYDAHLKAGARMVPFGGWEMPVQYTGIVEEHRKVRSRVGLFDVSHMGEFEVDGPGALDAVQRLTTNDAAALEVGQLQYSLLCYPDGGIVDDATVYRLGPEHFMVTVNASNIDKDWAWVTEQAPDARWRNESAATGLIAVQGPRAEALVNRLADRDVTAIGYFRFARGAVGGVSALISRSGYTGEDGFELYFDVKDAAAVWEGVMKAGAPYGIEAVGLGARDTLRLEMGYMLYGNDIDDSTNPLEAGIGWTVKLDRGDFIGRDALLRIKQEGLTRRLVGITADGRRVPRHEMVVEAGGRPVGQVTSGTFSPTLERAIAMAYVERGSAALDTALDVVSGSTRIPARVCKKPFHTGGSHK